MSKQGYKDQGFWFRLIFMLFYWLVLNVVITAFGVLVILVSIMKFGSKQEPTTLKAWLGNVTVFIGQTFDFLSFKEEDKPYPFQPWPQVKADDEA